MIVRRREEYSPDGYWELPGGEVKPGEQPEESIRREFVKELALEVKVGRALPLIECEYEHETVRLHPFYCTLDDQTAEAMDVMVAEHRWITADEIGNYTYSQANEQLMKDIAVLLGQHAGEGDGI